jgi:hypothetical protein
MDQQSWLTERFEETGPAARNGRLALTFTFTTAKVTRVEVIGGPARLRELDIAVL